MALFASHETWYRYTYCTSNRSTHLYVLPSGDPLRQRIAPEFSSMKLKDLVTVGTLGAGGFGRVNLVRHKDNRVFALKMISKANIIMNGQETHVQVLTSLLTQRL